MIGFSSTQPFDVQKIKTLILWNSLERGEDATGIYSPKNGLKKCLLKGSDFIINKNYEIEPDTMFMAHCRAKTIGLNTVNNAHPFERGNIILQHNGTIKNHYSLLSKYDLKYADYSVDSDVICGSINKTQNTEPLSEIDGPAAIVYTDTNEEGVLKVFRNIDRPLFRGYCEEGMYISSIKESLIFIGCERIKEFNENYLYSIKDGLLISKPKLILNKPYYHNYHNTNNASNDNVSFSTSVYKALDYHDVLNFKNCNVRLDVSCKYTINGFVLYPNTYYLIKDVTPSKSLLVYNHETKEQKEIYYNAFNRLDVLQNGSLVRALYEIHQHDDKNKILINFGQRVRVRNCAPGNELVDLVDPVTNKHICNASKSFFVKLTPFETQDFNSEINDIIFGNDNETEINAADQALEVMQNNIKNVEIVDEPEIEEGDYFEQLEDHFDKTNQTLEEIQELVSKDVLGNAVKIQLGIIDLIDENFKAIYKFLVEPEEEVIDNA